MYLQSKSDIASQIVDVLFLSILLSRDRSFAASVRGVAGPNAPASWRPRQRGKRSRRRRRLPPPPRVFTVAIATGVSGICASARLHASDPCSTGTLRQKSAAGFSFELAVQVHGSLGSVVVARLQLRCAVSSYSSSNSCHSPPLSKKLEAAISLRPAHEKKCWPLLLLLLGEPSW